MKKGFDNDKYIWLQSQKIRERIAQFDGKLYLEFGGKLFDDYHASRVLPGFEPDSKIRMLSSLKEDVEIIIAVNAADIEKNKVRGDLGISYEDEVIRLAKTFRSMDFFVTSVVITQYRGQAAVDSFRRRLQSFDLNSYLHYPIAGYPSNVEKIVSEEGYGRNEFVQTQKPLVVVTAPGPGSGKMATCLSQLYHENKHGVKAGYAKFETFPIWNLALNHPVNIAYEAATVDLDDRNMIDPFHLSAYNETTVNYNRDVEIYPVLKSVLSKIMGTVPYQSPTDMGVNMAGFCIYDDEAVCQASKREILRRYYQTAVEEERKGTDGTATTRMEYIMQTAGVTPEINPAVAVALQKAELTNAPAGAMELPDGTIVTGKTSPLMGAASALILNALKKLANIPDDVDIISPNALKPICQLNTERLGHRNPRLHTLEILIALTMSSAENPLALQALNQLEKLKGCDAHFSVILARKDEQIFKRLGVQATSQPRFENKGLFI